MSKTESFFSVMLAKKAINQPLPPRSIYLQQEKSILNAANAMLVLALCIVYSTEADSCSLFK
jgi:hypothetical protein